MARGTFFAWARFFMLSILHGMLFDVFAARAVPFKAQRAHSGHRAGAEHAEGAADTAGTASHRRGLSSRRLAGKRPWPIRSGSLLLSQILQSFREVRFSF